MQLDAVASLVPEGSDVRNMLDNAAKISDHSRKVARDAIWNLRVSHDVTGITFITQLENALKNAWPNEYDRKLTVQYQKMDQILTEGVSLTLIRIAQESVTNAFKHAHAEHIQVRWQAEGDTATLSIIDDGIGMNVGNIASFASRGHFGILGMKERIAHIGGSFEITSPPPHSSSGTMIAVHVNISASILDSPN
jgi:signal transduction histidine kinase